MLGRHEGGRKTKVSTKKKNTYKFKYISDQEPNLWCFRCVAYKKKPLRGKTVHTVLVKQTGGGSVSEMIAFSWVQTLSFDFAKQRNALSCLTHHRRVCKDERRIMNAVLKKCMEWLTYSVTHTLRCFIIHWLLYKGQEERRERRDCNLCSWLTTR